MQSNNHTLDISTGTIIKFILICIVFVVLFLVKELILVALTAIVIASAVEPITQWFVKRKAPRLLAVILVYLMVALVIISVVYFLVLPLLVESTNFLKNLPSYFNEKTLSDIGQNDLFQPFSNLKDTINIKDIVQNMNGFINSLSSSTFSTVSSIFGGILSFILIIVLSFYLSVDENGVAKFLRMVTPLKHEKYVINLWTRSQRKIGLWMQGQLVLAVIVGMLVYLGLTLLGVENALVLAFLAAAFEIIPLFGPVMSSIPAIALGFIDGGITLAILVMGWYLIVQQFENHLIYPLVVKNVIGVSPIVSILSLAIGYELAGFLGVILSVPIATALIEYFDDLEKDKLAKSKEEV